MSSDTSQSQEPPSSMILVECTWDHYCQGYEDASGYFLVKARDFEEACRKLEVKLYNARDFRNQTVE